MLIEEEIVGIQLVISQELKNRTVQLIAAGLGDDFNVCAGPAAISRIVQTCLNLEFLNGIRIGNGNTTLL